VLFSFIGFHNAQSSPSSCRRINWPSFWGIQPMYKLHTPCKTVSRGVRETPLMTVEPRYRMFIDHNTNGNAWKMVRQAAGKFVNLSGEVHETFGKFVKPSGKFVKPSGKFVKSSRKFVKHSRKFVKPSRKFVNSGKVQETFLLRVKPRAPWFIYHQHALPSVYSWHQHTRNVSVDSPGLPSPRSRANTRLSTLVKPYIGRILPLLL